MYEPLKETMKRRPLVYRGSAQGASRGTFPHELDASARAAVTRVRHALEALPEPLSGVQLCAARGVR